MLEYGLIFKTRRYGQALISAQHNKQHRTDAPNSLLIEHLYRSVIDDIALQDFLDGCSEATSSSVVALLHHNYSNPEKSSLQFNSAIEADDYHYRRFTAERDFVDRSLPYLQPGKVVRLSALLKESLFRKTQFHHYFCVENSYTNGMAVTIHVDDEHLVALFFNRPDTDPYTQQDQQWLEQLAPHLLNYYRLKGHVRKQDIRLRRVHKALDSMNFGVVMIGADKAVRFMNKRAQALVGRSDFLVVEKDQLRSKKADVDAWLNSRIRQASRSETGFNEANFTLMLHEGNERLHLFVLPLKSKDSGSLKSCVVLLSDIQINITRLSSFIAGMYGLSPRESQVAALLTQGLSAAQISARMQIKESTVRTLIKRVFAKTDVSRQVDLVRVGLSMNLH